MSKLSRDDKISVILEIIRLDPDHHDSMREMFADLSDEAVHSVYHHGLVMKHHFDEDEEDA